MLLAAALGTAVLVTASCSERYADAVIVDPEATDDEATGGNGSGSFDDSDAGNDGDRDPGYYDLCKPCSDDDDCGWDNDLCLQWPLGGMYCAMDCERDSDCPEGYECSNIQFLSSLDQCTPISGSCDDPTSDEPPTEEELRSFVLDLMNDLRDQYDIDPLTRSECLDGIAFLAVEEMQTTNQSGTLFRRLCQDEIPDCDCDWQEESQAWVPLNDRTWQDALEHHFSHAPEPGNDFQDVLDDDWARVGIGVDLDRDYVRLSVEFAPPEPPQ